MISMICCFAGASWLTDLTDTQISNPTGIKTSCSNYFTNILWEYLQLDCVFIDIIDFINSYPIIKLKCKYPPRCI